VRSGRLDLNQRPPQPNARPANTAAEGDGITLRREPVNLAALPLPSRRARYRR
jgi:hypothetical protein